MDARPQEDRQMKRHPTSRVVAIREEVQMLASAHLVDYMSALSRARKFVGNEPGDDKADARLCSHIGIIHGELKRRGVYA